VLNTQTDKKSTFVGENEAKTFGEKLVYHYLCRPKNGCPVRLTVRTSDFHSGNRGSIPLRGTKKALISQSLLFFIVFRFTSTPPLPPIWQANPTPIHYPLFLLR
jgi:hypothetical protein